MKVWITKYALFQGIFEVDARLCETMDSQNGRQMIVVRSPSTAYYHGNGREWHTDRASAIKRAEKMRKAKIGSLRKQIEKLESLRFE